MSISGIKFKTETKLQSIPLEPPPAELYLRVQAAIARDTAPSSKLPRRGWVLAALAAIATTGVGFDGYLRYRPVLRELHVSSLGACVLGAVVAAAIAVWTSLLALSRGPDGLGERIALLRGSALAVGPLSLVPMLILVSSDGHSHPSSVLTNPWGIPCAVMAMLISSAALAVLTWALKHSVPVATTWRSAALGSAAGAWSGLALLAHCPDVAPAHMLVGHLIPICVYPMIGLLAARRYIQL